jgi:hypothetical protein
VDNYTALQHPLETIDAIENADHLSMSKFQHQAESGYCKLLDKIKDILPLELLEKGTLPL